MYSVVWRYGSASLEHHYGFSIVWLAGMAKKKMGKHVGGKKDDVQISTYECLIFIGIGVV